MNHHALFFEANYKNDLDTVLDLFARDLLFEKQGNPDILYFLQEKLLIEGAREIKKFSSILPVKEKYLHVIIGFDSATQEAQNALLKALEEPGETVKFYIIAPSFNSIIPTIQSRLSKMEIKKGKEFLLQKEADKFIKGGKTERLKIAEKISDDLKNEKIQKSDIHVFLRTIKKGSLEKYSDNKAMLQSIAEADQYLESSSSVKQLLSLVALS